MRPMATVGPDALWAALRWADARAERLLRRGFTTQGLADRLMVTVADLEPRLEQLLREGYLGRVRTGESVVLYRLTLAGTYRARDVETRARKTGVRL